VDFGHEAERRYLSKRRERQRVEHGPRLRPQVASRRRLSVQVGHRDSMKAKHAVAPSHQC
jgi:hypothetical protein